MFVLTNHAVVDRGIAAVLATALVLWAVGAHFTVNAAGLVNVQALTTDSAPDAAVTHTIEFEMPSTGVGIDASGDAIRITYPAGFDISAVTQTDIALTVGGSSETVDGGAGNWTFGLSGQEITLTGDGTTTAVDDPIIIGINNDAIDNPSATGSLPLLIEILDGGTVVQDSGETRLVTIDNVIVTADVDTIFNFLISGLGSGVDVNGTSTTVVSSTTSVPLGTLAPGVPSIGGQELTVETNAQNGYTVTVETNQQLTAGNSADINSFTDGTDVAAGSAVVWAGPTGTLGSPDTYGHWGMTSEDASLAAGDVYGATLFSAVLTTPQEVMYHTGVTDGTVADEGLTQVAYAAEVMTFQEAADDYTAELTYIATPTF